MRTGYPAILIIEGGLAVVVGGGGVAARRTRNLLDAGARVRVVAPEAGPGIRAMASGGEIELFERRYRRGDLEGAALAIAATGDEEVDGGVHAEATERGIPVNVADDPRRCTFLAPATVRRGNLVVAVSTGGASPALAARIRERLEGEFGEEYGPVVEMLEGLRGAARLPDDPKERTRLWYRVVDSDVLALGLQGRLDEARRLALGILEGER